MKLSKRGLRGILIGYSLTLIAIGMMLIMKTAPEIIWMPIFIVGGLILLTVSAYKVGTPIFREDDQVEISLKRLFRRGK